MPRYPENFSFEHIHSHNDRETVSFENKFEESESISAEEVKKYARHIAGIVLLSQDLKEQKIALVDLLNDTSLAAMSVQKVTHSEPGLESIESPEDIPKEKFSEIVADARDVNNMAKFSAKEIKKKIIEELKKYISKELYFFIKDYVDPNPAHFNQKAIITDSKFNESFLKESDLSSDESKKELQKNLKTLALAFKNLSDPDTQMPYVARPEIIENTAARHPYDDSKIGYTVAKKDLTAIEDVLSEEKTNTDFTIRDVLLAIADCIKGAKFLAENGLTLTDINTYCPGKNLGIDNKTKKGILFDLDGLQKSGNKILSLIGPMGLVDDVKDLHSPEYRKIVELGQTITASTKSMVWEFGSTLISLATSQTSKLEKPNSYHIDKTKGWQKITRLAEKMTSEYQIFRPNFDSCIKELTEIINEYFNEDK